MATQSRDEAHQSECFQIRCLKSAVRLEPARRRGHEGLRSIDPVPTVSAAVRGPRDANFCVISLCGRGSSERLAAAIFNIRVDPLETRLGTEQRGPVRSSILSSCDRGRAVEGGRGLGSRS